MNKTNRLLIISICVISSIGGLSAQEKVDQSLIASINKFVDQADNRFSRSHNRIEIESKTSKDKPLMVVHLFTMRGNQIERLTIEFLQEDYKEIETYYFEEGNLVLAREAQWTKDNEDVWWDPWSAGIYVSKGKVIFITSVGHGKTEDDDWKPNPEKTSRLRIKRLRTFLRSIR
ncbi:MAG: hypothetical protein HKN25_15415 [Pyrinomonadaceae bacterium]|nr:hypothetical protein [Pyrinomonadaceae bacterium]